MENRIIAENEIDEYREPLDAQTENPVRKTSSLRKAFNTLGSGAFVLLLITMVFLVFSMVQSRLTSGPPSVAGYQMYIVLGGSMSPAFEAGSLAFLKPIETENIGVGDIITYRSVGGGDTLTTHRVMDVNWDGSALSFTTRGDANLVDDSAPVYPENIVGRVLYTVPYAGYLMNFGQTKTGVIALVFIPGGLIIAFELRNLFRIAAEWEEEKALKKKAESKSLSEEA